MSRAPKIIPISDLRQNASDVVKAYPRPENRSSLPNGGEQQQS